MVEARSASGRSRPRWPTVELGALGLEGPGPSVRSAVDPASRCSQDTADQEL